MRSALTLVEQLKELGLRQSDWLAVFGDVGGTPEHPATDEELDCLIGALLGAVGPEGHVLTPTFSSGEQFDVDASPATTGRLAERFRRWPGVTRSRHPIYSIALWGPQSLAIVRDHDLYLPFRAETPFGQLVERDGKILHFGGNQADNPVIHVARLAAEQPRPALWVCVHVATEFGGTRKKRFVEAPCSRAYAALGGEFLHRGIARSVQTDWGEALWMPARAVYDYVTILERHEPERLLCAEKSCRWCKAMRRLLEEAAR